MADEDITLDGKPLQSLRVADLKAALEQRNLSKSGQKNTLIKRLKGALMLENLQKSSSSHCGLQPNSQIGQEMSQNSFIQQYLAKQQELLRQRLEREAQQNEGANDRPVVVEDDEDQSEDNDSSLHVSNKHSQPSVTRVQEKADPMLGPGITAPSEMQQSAFHQGHKEPPTPSPPRAIASLSVRVLAQPPAIPRTNEEGAAPTEPGSAHPVLHLSRSAGDRADDDSDAEDSDDAESEDDEDWGPGPGGARRGNRAPSQPQQVPPSMPATFARSKRKLQPPQHIPPPPLAHHAPMQLRHPTPPPSPPPNLFPLPDTPKQSPPDTGEQEGEGARGPRGASFAPPSKDSDSSSCSSSPEPSAKRKPGPLSLLVQKMESEGAFHAGEESAGGPASSSKSPPHMAERRSLQEGQGVAEVRQLKKERQPEKIEEKEQEQKSLQADTEEEGTLVKEGEVEEEKRSQDVPGRKEEKPTKQREEPEKGEKKVRGEIQNSDSSSDSDSKSDSSTGSSSSSSSSEDKSNQLKKSDQDQKVLKTNLSKGDNIYHSRSEVSPSAPGVTEMEAAESESSVVSQPPPGTEPENREDCTDEIADPAPKAFAARKISLTSAKTPPANPDGGMSEADAGNAAGRKRRWGSSTSVIAKKPSISITTDSLKSLIPDIKVNQEAVVELHPEELQLSGDEESPEAGRDDQDKGLKIRRTVTQVVPSESHENGQANEEEEMETAEEDSQHRDSRDKRKDSVGEEAPGAQASTNEAEAEKVAPSDGVVRRSISQQKSGVSITIDDPIRTTRQPSPSRGKLSNIVHVTNLVRPFTLGQLKELLNRTGTVVEEGFWIDKIKSHCFVTYATTEEAVATRDALHRVKWPQSNPKVLNVDFCEQDELDFHKGILKPEEKEDHAVQPSAPQNRLPPLMPERDRDRERDKDKDKERDRDRDRERDRGPAGVRDLWAEREKEMQRRERARGEREWDRDKVREFARPGEEERRSRSRDRERRRRERGKSKERKTEKKAEKADEPPAKLLDDLFLKTKAAPCIYWLPLTEEQVLQKVLDRTERQKERERRHKEQKEEEEKKREEEKKERLKAREKEGGASAGSGGGGAARGADGERERGRDREGDKKRDSGHRPRRLSEGPVGLRRSRSRSNPRDRRR